MGEGVSSQIPRSYSEVFEEQCPFYLAIGMTADEYWNGDNSLPKYYLKAYKLKQEQQNYEAWLHGLYVYDAMVSTMSHMNKNKSDRKSYAEKPYDFTTKKQEDNVIEAKARAEVWLKSWVSATQKMYKE